ncbi:hypothetical protein ACFL2Z_04845 [Candidatus Eisenbacteria bacterium]|uniref:Uncharacterized protein n=1 Tax=Eiseniibacteriota bacterium TaxID=2212470 RepID=A0ABV6YQL3_UNCEI
MTELRFRKLLGLSIAAGCILLLLFTACSEKSGGTRVPNIPPETSIAFGPTPDSLTYYKVQAYWYGTDADGDVIGFQVKTVKNVDSLNSIQDIDWPPVIRDSVTVSRESLFVLQADSCCMGEGETSSALSSWGLLVRAVDDQWAPSEEPAVVFFKAGNAIPKVKIVVPEKLPIEFMDVPSHPFVEWEGEDPDGDASQLEYKYLVIPAADVNPSFPRLPPFSHEGSGGGYASPEIGTWSEWVPADCTFVKDIDLSLYRGTQEKVWVYITVKDEGGAVLGEKLFVSYNNASNGIKLLVVETGSGVTTIIDGGALGRRSSMKVAEYESNIAGVFLGTEVSFRFWAEEEAGRGEIAESYRFYWDSPEDPGSAWNYWSGTAPIRDPGTTPEWFVRYPVDGGRLMPSLGRHVFVVDLKDLNQVISHCEFHLEILEGPRRAPEKKILLVDDDNVKWLEPSWGAHDDAQNALWDDILEGYNWEEFDTGDKYQYELPIRMVDQATTVIWMVDQDTEGDITHLLEVCSQLGNYLQSYVNVGGNLILLGRDPSYASGYWPDGTPPFSRRPNFTDWDFRPRWDAATEESLFNWNWEIFGIEKMRQPSPAKPYNTLWPCDGCAEAFADTIEMGPQADRAGVEGSFQNAFYITDLREDINVVPLYSTAIDTSGEWVTSGNEYIAVYVPGNDLRGHAAYIGAPEYWFDHAKIKDLIRKLLEEFGEEPVGY